MYMLAVKSCFLLHDAAFKLYPHMVERVCEPPAPRSPCKHSKPIHEAPSLIT